MRFAEKRRAPAAEDFLEALKRDLLQLSDSFNAEGLKRRFRDSADAGNSAHAKRSEKRSLAARGHPNEAARFGLVARDFCNEARGREPARAGKARRGSDFTQQFIGCGERRAM